MKQQIRQGKEKKRRAALPALVLSIVLLAVFLSSCGGRGSAFRNQVAATEVGRGRIGMIYVGDDLEGWTGSHMKGIREAIRALNIPDDMLIELDNVGENGEAYDAAVSLIKQGCDLIFATSYGFEEDILRAARDYPDIQFAHCSGIRALDAGLPNFHNYFDRIFEARYVSGVAAGMKLREMLDDGRITAETCKVGYVGAFPYAEVISGYTAFFLGVRSVVPEATMKVSYTNSWTDMDRDYLAAQKLLQSGCVLLSQHSDSAGVAYVCQDNAVPFVGFNISMISIAPDTAITSSTNDWGKYYEYAIAHFRAGEPFAADWSGGYTEGIVDTTELGPAAAEGTESRMEEAVSAIMEGRLHVFSADSFTVNGETLGPDYTDAQGGHPFADGCYHESERRGAPSFDFIIDGISELTEEETNHAR